MYELWVTKDCINVAYNHVLLINKNIREDDTQLYISR